MSTVKTSSIVAERVFNGWIAINSTKTGTFKIYEFR
jgi:hypothetical protein